MIFDLLENIHLYTTLSKGFPEAARFLLRSDLRELEVGKHEIDGDNVYAMVSKEPGRDKKDAQLELHKKYIDIQLVLSGTDEMGWKPSVLCRNPTAEFDMESDIQFFSDAPDVWLPVKPGYFVVFFPEDAHMPLIADGILHKVVVKVAA